MELLLQQVLAGLATGAIYAAMALAVVMIYQAIDHLNFAQGEMAMFSTFLAWQMLQWGWPYWAAFIVAVALSFVGGVVIDRILFKPIQNAPILSQLAAFIALYSILNSSAGVDLGFQHQDLPDPVRHGAAVRRAPDQHPSGRHDRGHLGDAGLPLFLLPRLPPWPGDARRGDQPGLRRVSSASASAG